VDGCDCKPLDLAINPGAAEVCDGVDNACNGVADFGFPDTDGDGLKNCVDPDDDGDNDPDGTDCEPLNITVFTGAPELCDGKDNDCDTNTDEGHLDTDSDTIADCVDLDDDGDTVPDATDNCPLVSNTTQIDIDEDGIGDACDPTLPGPVAKIVIRDGPKGAGAEIGDLTVLLGTDITLYAAGHDAAGLFAGGQDVNWSVEGNLDAVAPAADGKTAQFAPVTPVTVGKILATPKVGGVTLDKTGTITVSAPPPGPVDLGKCTIEPQRNSIVADGLDEMVVKVVLRDQYGTATTVGGPHVVALATTKGTLFGPVTNQGAGVFTQTLRSSNVEEPLVELSATVGGQSITAVAVVSFVQPELTVTDAVTIDCNNFNAFEGKSILVDGGTLTINNTDLCPLMKFGSMIIKSGTLTHDKGARINIEVTEMFVDVQGVVSVTAKGPGLGSAAPPSIDQRWEIYGDYRNPTRTGRSNMETGPSTGLPGGLVRVKVTGAGKFTLDGKILADGLDITCDGGNCAFDSGGRVLIDAKVLSGDGTIQALGRDAGGDPWSAGNGGVVALVGYTSRTGSFSDTFIYDRISVRPGKASLPGSRAPSGVLYMKSATAGYGDVVMGAGLQSGIGFTTSAIAGAPKRTSVPDGVITALTANSITSAGAGWEVDRYVGLYVNPNIDQGIADDLTKDVLLRVVQNSADTLFVSSTPLGVASIGDTFRGIDPMDNLELRNKASFQTAGDVVILSGDRHSDDQATLEMIGGFKAKRVDVGTVEAIRLKDVVDDAIGPGINSGLGANLIYEKLWRKGDAAFLFDFTVTQAASLKITGNLLCKNLTVDTGTVQATGDITVAGTPSLKSASVEILEGNWVDQTIAFQALSGTLVADSSQLTAPNIDLAAGTALQINAGGLTAKKVIHLGDATFPLDWTLDTAAVDIRGIMHAKNITATGTTSITAGAVAATAAFNVTGALTDLATDGAFGDESVSAETLSFIGKTLNAKSITTTGDATLGGSDIVPTITVGGTLTVDNGAFITTQTIAATGDVIIQGTSTLTHPPATTATVYSLAITGDNMTISTGSNINLNRRGFAQGRTIGNTTTGGAVAGVGGSHGGLGGLGLDTFATTPDAYGDLRDPTIPGGGGGGLQAFGGGVLRLTLTNKLTLNGTIMANGKFISGGGGAGGSISISAGQVTGGGAGSIQALGGDALDGTSGGGGGGRVALRNVLILTGNFAPTVLTNNVRAYGGSGLNNGGAGTIHLSGPGLPLGTLFVDNGGTVAPSGSTPLPTLTPGLVSALTANTLSAGAAQPAVDRFKGYDINPNVAQGAATLGDDTVAKITTHDLAVFTTTGADLTTIASVGDTYRAIFRFDNLQVQGGAQLTTPADILVLSGDSASNDAVSFAVGANASVTAGTLDLTNVLFPNISGSVSAGTLLCFGCP